MNTYRTEQGVFWQGEFGDHYLDRNQGAVSMVANMHLFSRVFARTNRINSLIEFGANISLNLQAIKRLIHNIELSAIEINKKAAAYLTERGGG